VQHLCVIAEEQEREKAAAIVMDSS
jgi:hypothetical protein